MSGVHRIPRSYKLRTSSRLKSRTQRRGSKKLPVTPLANGKAYFLSEAQLQEARTVIAEASSLGHIVTWSRSMETNEVEPVTWDLYVFTSILPLI